MVDADHLYAADYHWWNFHCGDIARDFDGKCWSCDPSKEGKRTHSNWPKGSTPEAWGVTVLRCLVGTTGLSTDANYVHSGGNSGYQAINLALHLGATRIILLGFDMHCHSGLSHFFGDHPPNFISNTKYERFIAAYRTIKPEQYGIEILNCSRETALDMFPRHNLEDVL